MLYKKHPHKVFTQYSQPSSQVVLLRSLDQISVLVARGMYSELVAYH